MGPPPRQKTTKLESAKIGPWQIDLISADGPAPSVNYAQKMQFEITVEATNLGDESWSFAGIGIALHDSAGERINVEVAIDGQPLVSPGNTRQLTHTLAYDADGPQPTHARIYWGLGREDETEFRLS